MKNKCGCEEESKGNIEENLINDTECGCGETTGPKKTDEGCGCEETTKPTQADEGCGCGESHDESHEEGGCCGDIEIPDLSRVENPENPKFLAEPNFFKEIE